MRRETRGRPAAGVEIRGRPLVGEGRSSGARAETMGAAKEADMERH